MKSISCPTNKSPHTLVKTLLYSPNDIYYCKSYYIQTTSCIMYIQNLDKCFMFL